MAGANYMGGKRNAAKARSRDTTGRAQKGFFGRQRFELLTKALGSTHDHHDTAQKRQRAGKVEYSIDLAHAKRDMRRSVPNSVTPATPQPRPIMSNQDSQSGSRTTRSPGSRNRSSRVLAALDTSEPIFLRAEMDRILAIPDLAGLSFAQNASPSSLKSRSALLKRRQPISDRSPDIYIKKKPRHYNNPVDIQSSGLYEGYSSAHKYVITQRMEANSESRPFLESLNSPFSGFKPALPINNPFSLVPDYATTLSSIVDDAGGSPGGEKLYTAVQQDNSFESMELVPSTDNDDSGYAEFEVDLQNHADEPENVVIRTRGYISQRRPLYQRDSSILYLDTPPAPSLSRPFMDVEIQSQFSVSTSSSLGLSFSDYPFESPQVFTARDPFTTPPSFAKRALHRMNDNFDAERDMPSSSVAEPPPPTFCLPSPKKGPAFTFLPKSPATVSDLSDILEHVPNLSSPFQPSTAPSPNAPRGNLLDEPDPWDAIGKLLNLPVTSRSSALPQSTTCQLNLPGLPPENDRSGVGYIAPANENHLNERARRERALGSDVYEWTSPKEPCVDHVQVWPELATNLSLHPLAQKMDIAATSELAVSPLLTTMLTPDPEIQTGIDDTESMESIPLLGRSPETLKSTSLMLSDDMSSTGLQETNLHTGLASPTATNAFTFAENALESTTSLSDTRATAKTADIQGPYLFFGLDEDEE